MVFCWFFNLGLVFFLRKCFEDAVDSGGTTLKSADHILGRRLQKSDNIGDEFVLALDRSEGIQLVGAHVNGLFNVCAFEQGQGVAFLHEVLEEFGRSVTHVGAHQRGRLFQCRVKLGIIAIEALESFVEKRVLYNDQLDVGVETCATQCRSLLSVKSGGLYQIEAALLTDGLGNFVDD